MAQLRRSFEKFESRDVAVVVVGPENARQFAEYFEEHDLPFIGLPDPKHRVLKQYGQEIKLFKLGRMPAQLLIDRQGIVRFIHYGQSMRDIPSPRKMLDLVDEIAGEAVHA